MRKSCKYAKDDYWDATWITMIMFAADGTIILHWIFLCSGRGPHSSLLGSLMDVDRSVHIRLWMVSLWKSKVFRGELCFAQSCLPHAFDAFPSRKPTVVGDSTPNWYGNVLKKCHFLFKILAGCDGFYVFLPIRVLEWNRTPTVPKVYQKKDPDELSPKTPSRRFHDP